MAIDAVSHVKESYNQLGLPKFNAV